MRSSCFQKPALLEPKRSPALLEGNSAPCEARRLAGILLRCQCWLQTWAMPLLDFQHNPVVQRLSGPWYSCENCSICSAEMVVGCLSTNHVTSSLQGGVVRDPENV